MAELEILNWLVGFFCPTPEAASTCREFISSHSNVLPPVGPIFYFLLFPAVFTILFIMVLMRSVNVAQGNKGIQLLLGVTAFIFIIISGWYPVMLVLSEFWYIAIILLGFLWFLKGHFGKGGGGGGTPSGKMSALSLGESSGGSLGAELMRRGMARATGKEKRMEKEVDLKLKDLRDIKEDAHNGKPEAWRAYADVKNSAWAIIHEFRDLTSMYGIPVGGGYEKKIEEMESILNELERKKPKNLN